MVSGIISRVVILVFGTLYPAYSSYKAVKSRNGRDYVKWMMYWIVFALFTAVETFADVFISWIPFYYEIKILFVIWLLSPATKGSSFLYRKFVHPQLMKREKDIDEYITQVTDKGCTALLQIGSKGLNMCATTVMQTAIKGQSAVVDHLRKSYSMNDLSDPNAKYPDPGSDNDDDEQDETDYYGPRKQQLGYTKEKARSSRQHQHDLSRVIEQEEEVEPVRRRSGRDKERTSSTGHISTRSTFSRSTSSTSSTSSSAASTTVPGGTQYRWMTRLGYNKHLEKNEQKPSLPSISREQVSCRTRSRSRRD